MLHKSFENLHLHIGWHKILSLVHASRCMHACDTRWQEREHTATAWESARIWDVIARFYRHFLWLWLCTLPFAGLICFMLTFLTLHLHIWYDAQLSSCALEQRYYYWWIMDYYGRKIFLFLMKFLKFLFDDFYCFIWALSSGWNISHKWFVYCVDEKLIASEIGCYLIMEHNWPWNHASTHSTFDFIVSMLTC